VRSVEGSRGSGGIARRGDRGERAGRGGRGESRESKERKERREMEMYGDEGSAGRVREMQAVFILYTHRHFCQDAHHGKVFKFNDMALHFQIGPRRNGPK
jgi:hypothetical protein